MNEFDNINDKDVGETDNVIILDDDGNEVPFEFLDLIEYEGKEYVVLLPIDDDTGEIVILQVEDAGDPELENYVPVQDERVLMSIFEIFKEKFKDEFNFAE